MEKIKLTACLIAAVTAVAVSSCGKSANTGGKTASSEESSSQAVADTSAEDESAAESSASADSAQESQADSIAPEVPEYKPGDLLKAAAEKFSGDYTYILKMSYSDQPEAESEVTQVKSGDNFYMSMKESGSSTLAADTAYLKLSDTAYDIDNNIGAYQPCEIKNGLELLDNIISNKLDRTSTHLPADAGDYQIEEYTYTGDSYITVYDLYFDDKGDLKKYTVCYSGEGEDDLIQTAEVVSFEQTADDKYFKPDLLGDLKDFSAFTEDERLAFCQKVCGDFGITTDNMYSMHISTDDLKRIDYDTFIELVYTYGKKAETEEKSKDKEDKKEDKDKDSSAADDSTVSSEG